MSATRRYTIDLPEHVADAVDRQVAAGPFTSVSELIEDNLRDLVDYDAAVEHWLREEVVPAIHELDADPSIGIPAEEVMDRILARHRSR